MSQPAGRDTYSHLHQMFLPHGLLPEASACDPHLYGDLLGIVVSVTGGSTQVEAGTGSAGQAGCPSRTDSSCPPYLQPPQPLVLTLILIP